MRRALLFVVAMSSRAVARNPWTLCVALVAGWVAFRWGTRVLEVWLWSGRDGYVRLPMEVFVSGGSLTQIPSRTLLAVAAGEALVALALRDPRSSPRRVFAERATSTLGAAAPVAWSLWVLASYASRQANAPWVVPTAIVLTSMASLVVCRVLAEAITRTRAAHGPWLLLAIDGMYDLIQAAVWAGAWEQWQSLGHDLRWYEPPQVFRAVYRGALIVCILLTLGRHRPRGEVALGRGASFVAPIEWVAVPRVAGWLLGLPATWLSVTLWRLCSRGATHEAYALAAAVGRGLVEGAAGLAVVLWLRRRERATARWPSTLALALLVLSAIAYAWGRTHDPLRLLL